VVDTLTREQLQRLRVGVARVWREADKVGYRRGRKHDVEARRAAA
jgi:hypothetical protein